MTLVSAVGYDVSPVEATESPPAKMVAVAPCRLLDTRTAAGGALSLVSGGTVNLPITERCGVPSDATAVALALTVADPLGPGYLTGWAAGTSRPSTSTLNWSRANETRSNGAILPIGRNGSINLFAPTSAELVVDVFGYFVPAQSARDGRFVPLTPRRLLDTRDSSALPPNGVQRVPLPADVPDDACAVSVNLTTTASPGPGFLSAYAAGTARPLSAVVNTDGAGQTRGAGAIVPVSPEGFDVHSSVGGHLIIDVNGYFTGPSARASTDGLLVMIHPTRLMDTRDGVQTQFYANGSQALDTTAVSGRVSAVVTNITMTEPAGPAFLTAFPAATAKPWISSLNVDGPDQTVANMAIVPSGAAGLYLYSMTTAHLVVDMTGWFTGPPLPADASPHVLSNPRPPPDRTVRCTRRVALRWPTASASASGCARTAVP